MVQIIRFHFVENLQRWRATYRAIKADAAENGRPTPAVYGNVHIVENAYSVIVSQYQDVVWTETPAFFPRVGNPTWGSPASGFSALQYKLGQSCGNFSKPHWGIVTLTGCGLAPTGFRPQDGKPQIMTSVLAAAEAVANGASAVMLLGDTVSADECLPAAQRWASFVDRHRHLFGPERHREADVVILCFPISFYLRAPRADCLLKLSVIHTSCLPSYCGALRVTFTKQRAPRRYSIPTRFWAQDTSLAVSFDWIESGQAALPLDDAFSSLARVAEDHAISYDVLILDHPDLSHFNHLRTRLHTGYRLAVLPVVLALSEADAVDIAAWVRSGGVLTAVDWRQTGMYDEDYRPRPHSSTPGGSRCLTLQNLLADPGKGQVRRLDASMHRYATKGFRDKIDDALIATAINPPVDNHTALLRTPGLPRTVWINVWKHGMGPMRTLQLVNYDGNASSNMIYPVISPFTVHLRCTDSAGATLGCKDITNVSITCPAGVNNASGSTQQLALNKQEAADHIILSTAVPGGSITGELCVIAFSASGEWELRSAAASARKWLERLRIASRSRGLDRMSFVGLLSSSAKQLQTVQEGRIEKNVLRKGAGAQKFLTLAALLELHVENITQVLTASDLVRRKAVVGLGSGTMMAVAARAPANTKWQNLTQYSSSTGCGWTDLTARTTLVSAESTLDTIHGAAVGGKCGERSHLRIDIPSVAGSGVVTLISGSFDTGRMAASTAINVKGAVAGGSLSIPGGYDRSGEFRHIAFRFNCSTNRSLYLQFGNSPCGNFYGDGYGLGLHTEVWQLNAILVTSGIDAPTSQGRQYLTLADSLIATQIRNYSVIGPFHDQNFTGRERAFGPEAGPVNSHQMFPDGAGGQVRWQSLTVPDGQSGTGLPPAMASQSTNGTVVVYFASSLLVPPRAGGGGSINVTLSGSTRCERCCHHLTAAALPLSCTDFKNEVWCDSATRSSLASFTLNGDRVGDDRLVTGLLLHEFSMPLRLKCGISNELRVKVSQLSWGSDFKMALSVHQPGSMAPVAGLRVSSLPTRAD